MGIGAPAGKGGVGGVAGAGVDASAFTGSASEAGFTGADLRGMIPNSRLRLRAATSSLVVVSGFNCAGRAKQASLACNYCHDQK